MKNALVLGAGLVAKPLVEYLLKSGFFVTVASKSDRGAAFIAQEHKNGTAVKLAIRNTGQLSTMIKKNDVVVSLMPSPFPDRWLFR